MDRLEVGTRGRSVERASPPACRQGRHRLSGEKRCRRPVPPAAASRERANARRSVCGASRAPSAQMGDARAAEIRAGDAHLLACLIKGTRSERAAIRTGPGEISPRVGLGVEGPDRADGRVAVPDHVELVFAFRTEGKIEIARARRPGPDLLLGPLFFFPE